MMHRRALAFAEQRTCAAGQGAEDGRGLLSSWALRLFREKSAGGPMPLSPGPTNWVMRANPSSE